MVSSHAINESVKQELLLIQIRDYWNEHIHDLEIATHPVGSAEFFRELDTYRFEKLALSAYISRFFCLQRPETS